MNQTNHLYRLQIIDLDLDKCQKRIREIIFVLENNNTVKKAEENHQLAKQTLQKSRLALRSLEESARDLKIKMEISQNKLYSGNVRNPKELQDLQNEIESLKRRLEKVENEQLDAMIDVEKAEKEQILKQSELSQTQSDFSGQSASLLGEKGKLLRQCEIASQEREAILESISQDNIELYNRLRARKNGVAVAVIEVNACSACGAELRSSELQSARSKREVTYCPSCGRILFAG